MDSDHQLDDGPQSEGCFKRINGSMLKNNGSVNQLVSVVGRFVRNGHNIHTNHADGRFLFQTTDNVQIQVLLFDQCNIDTTNLDYSEDSVVVELVGTQVDGTTLQVRFSPFFAHGIVLLPLSGIDSAY
jgi:hypothetical protein